jgi:hypothetical protein
MMAGVLFRRGKEDWSYNSAFALELSVTDTYSRSLTDTTHNVSN